MIKDFIFALILIVGCVTLGTFLWDAREDLNRSPAIKARLGYAACIGGVVACVILVVFGSILLLQVGCDFFMGVDQGTRIFRRF